MNPLLQLARHGQSYWLDNLTRKMIRNGELKKRIDEQGLRGITSNPKIFHKAISGADGYDDQLEHLAREGRSAQEIYEALAVSDVREACDLLRRVYDETEGVDGYVSLEVSPYLAHDSEGTMQEVRRLWDAVDRPNVFIKIPGTPAGVPAIEQMLYEGVNVNITLLFGIPDYEAVARAYFLALERRVSEGKPVDRIASVASFFLSRIDVLTDQLLGHRIRTGGQRGPRAEQLFGRAAIASARLAYQSFKKIFRGPRWEALQAKGARVQRPLWASTSTKDPLYGDVRYVEPLIGRDTVNTMPAETIAAFADHGRVEPDTVEQGVDEARQVMLDLAKVGIDLDRVVWQLQNEGAQKFIDPYDELLHHLSRRREEALGAQANQQTLTPGNLEGDFAEVSAAMRQLQWGRRLFARDASLWTEDEEEAERTRRQLAWVDAIRTFRGRAEEVDRFGEEVKADGFRHLVLLGGGSVPAWVSVWREVIGEVSGRPALVVLDDLGLGTLRAIEAEVDLERTLFVVADHPDTEAVLGAYHHFADRLGGVGRGTNHPFVALTNPGSRLAEEMGAHSLRHHFENPEPFEGPFAGFSYFGLVPLAVLGVDVVKLLERAGRERVACDPFVPPAANPGMALGVLLAAAERQGRSITLAFQERFRAFGTWVRDLLAGDQPGSLGLTVEETEKVAPPDGKEPGRVFVFLRQAGGGEEHAEPLLAQAGQPTARITLPGPIDLGGEFFRWQVAVATAGAILGRNPFLGGMNAMLEPAGAGRVTAKVGASG
jgi:transaldolase/glucose-6-phosphate isomerase